MIIINVLLIITTLFVGFHLLTKRYISPFRLHAYIGRKGCGKSTLLTKQAYNALKKGRAVYSTEDLKFNIKGKTYSTVVIDPFNIYNYNYPPNSLILIDEINLYHDNREFANKEYSKKFKPVIEWYRLQRHFKVEVHVYTQTWDYDRKVRGLTDDFWLCQKFLRVFVIARHMIKKPVVVHPTGDSPARVDDDFIEDGLLLAPFGGMQIAFIPRWARMFDSFKTPNDAPSSNSTAILSP